jgi:pilus assembly protein Flp/PilA
MFEYIKSWLLSKRSEKGQDLAEYALLIGLIALIVVLAVTLLGTNISTIFSQIASAIGTWGPFGT